MSVKINYSTVGFVNWGQDFKTLYNDLLNYFNLTTTNYDILLNNVTLIANWYLDNAGGN